MLSVRALLPVDAAISAARSAQLVDDRRERDALERRENPGVMPAQVADADDGNSQGMRIRIWDQASGLRRPRSLAPPPDP